MEALELCYSIMQQCNVLWSWFDCKKKGWARFENFRIVLEKAEMRSERHEKIYSMLRFRPMSSIRAEPCLRNSFLSLCFLLSLFLLHPFSPSAHHTDCIRSLCATLLPFIRFQCRNYCTESSFISATCWAQLLLVNVSLILLGLTAPWEGLPATPLGSHELCWIL